MKKALFVILMLAVFFSFVSADSAAKKNELLYPRTKKVDVIDDYHGTKVADPYRWLEDDNAPEVKAWVEEQNQVTFGYLNGIACRGPIARRLEELFNYPRYSAPFRVGAYYFFSKNDGLQNQSVIYYQQGLDGEPQVFIDPNTLSADGTVRIGLMGESQDDRYMAIARSEAGSDWQEIRVWEIASRRELPDRLRWVKFSGAAWSGDGFYYSRYDEPKAGDELKAKNENQKVYYHKLGEPQEKDTLVFADPRHPLRYYGAGVSEDKRFLFLYISEGTHGSEIHFRDLTKKDDPFHLLCPGFEFDYSPIDNIGTRFLVHTNCDAPNYRVVAIDAARPGKENWETVIAEKGEVLLGANSAGGKLFCNYLKDVTTRVSQHDLSGKLEREIVLPGLGSAGGFGGKKEDRTLFYTFTSFNYPPVIFQYDIASGESRLFRKSEAKFTPEDYEVRQVFYASKDGTRVPMFIVHKKGLKLDGGNPAYLYAYGGFNASMSPYFSAGNLVFLENGGVYAVANIRGGGEYGEAWHRAGMLEKKQNVFDDFIAAAEYLLAEKYTRSDKLAISGASNGGLLVGAVMAQRPDLFRVALPAVGVMDMLRYHKFTVGWGWSVEYGSSDDAAQFKYLYAYSPLHNLKPGVSYPATLVTTADHDDRVVPAHSFKFIAALQEMHRGGNPVLIRIETRSGHGSSNLRKAIEISADTWGFVFKNLGMECK
ncbi:MAG: prolyl oligopeptidase family serine peptidase [Acidobacteria bacterium]|jgi:prolyl oligopeptidase|nr:prolyl oligopeptidase family serine peptidase [Acidobacteriota bacterium]